MALQGEVEANRGMVVCNSKVAAVSVQDDGFHLRIAGAGSDEFVCSVLVNSAGFWAQELASSFENCVGGNRARGALLQVGDRGEGLVLPVFGESGGDRALGRAPTRSPSRPPVGARPSARLPQVHYAKAHYFSYQGKSPFEHLIYPLPTDGGLGIHATNDLSGAARFGPDVTWVDEINYEFDESRKADFVNAIRSYFPGLDEERLTPAYTGIRPKLSGAGGPVRDFVIQGEADHGVAGLVNLFGIESPGLTACLAIGEYVQEILL